MKKLLVLALALSFILSALGTLPALAAPIQPIRMTLNKRILTLSKGKSATLKAILTPVKPDATVTWESSNPKIAKVSSSGKVTAVAPGTVWITATIENHSYSFITDNTGFGNECFVTVEGSPKDPKPLGASDQTFYYGSKKFTIPTWTKAIKYYPLLMNILDIIGDDSVVIDEVDTLDVRSVVTAYYCTSATDRTEIYYDLNAITKAPHGFGLDINSTKSPIKTNRGIKLGGTKSAVTKAYGLPTYFGSYKENGVKYESYTYHTYSLKPGYALVMYISFKVQKSTARVTAITYYYGLLYIP